MILLWGINPLLDNYFFTSGKTALAAQVQEKKFGNIYFSQQHWMTDFGES